MISPDRTVAETRLYLRICNRNMRAIAGDNDEAQQMRGGVQGEATLLALPQPWHIWGSRKPVELRGGDSRMRCCSGFRFHD